MRPHLRAGLLHPITRLDTAPRAGVAPAFQSVLAGILAFPAINLQGTGVWHFLRFLSREGLDRGSAGKGSATDVYPVSLAAFKASAVYRNLGTARSVTKVARELDKSRALVGRWSRQSRWVPVETDTVALYADYRYERRHTGGGQLRHGVRRPVPCPAG
ncbi:hypothetical protein GCM10022233_87630 [Streptomyces shaanxiensis]|uniref:Uncharacterized protein n=1 Tax=Streptomyces shaanxiensis TaxID=653357 RepID=A0ABP7WKF1_9ACTN